MRWTERLQGLRLMKFEDVYGRSYRGELSQLETAEILGMSERTFRRWRDRFEAEGADGLYDCRLGRVSAIAEGVGSASDSDQAQFYSEVEANSIYGNVSGMS